MTKKLRTLLAAGLIYIVSAGSMAVAHADSTTTQCSKGTTQRICVLNNITSNNLIELLNKLHINAVQHSTCTSANQVLLHNLLSLQGATTSNVVTASIKAPEVAKAPTAITTKAPAKAPATDSSSFAYYQQEILQLVNQERAKAGLKPLTLNAELSKVATMKTDDMMNNHYFSHTSPTYGSPFDMMERFGISYRAAGENIAEGQENPQAVMNAWMNSAGHRANILRSKFTQLGVGVSKSAEGRLYWDQMFIGQ